MYSICSPTSQSGSQSSSVCCTEFVAVRPNTTCPLNTKCHILMVEDWLNQSGGYWHIQVKNLKTFGLQEKSGPQLNKVSILN